MDTILIIGTGQIGKATLFRLLQKRPKKVIVHNLTRQESQDCIKLFRSSFKGTKFVESHGNIFMPHSLKDLTREELSAHSREVIDYFYSELSEDLLKQSSIYNLVSKHRPDVIVDAVNSATVLGNAYNPEKRKEKFEKAPNKCCVDLMANDFVTSL